MQKLRKLAGSALSTFPTVINSYESARTAIQEGVPGDFVECGVFAGTQCAAMATALMESKDIDRRRVHLFDSFEGIPQAGPRDDATITGLIGEGDGSLSTTGVSACSLENVQRNMKRWHINGSLLRYHKGWFQHTVPQNMIDKIAVLRLDGDLYESTKVCLQYLYPKVSPRGFVVIDDYALTGCRAAVDEYLAAHDLTPTIVKIEGGKGPVYWRT